LDLLDKLYEMPIILGMGAANYNVHWIMIGDAEYSPMDLFFQVKPF